MNNLLIVGVLIVICILLIIQLIFIIVYRRRYFQSCQDRRNLNRVIQIVRNQLADSERERKWLNNQITMLTSSGLIGKDVDDLLNKVGRKS